MWTPQTVETVNRFFAAQETGAPAEVQIAKSRAAVLALLEEAMSHVATCDVHNVVHVLYNIAQAQQHVKTLQRLLEQS